jgi:hypothetical protein
MIFGIYGGTVVLGTEIFLAVRLTKAINFGILSKGKYSFFGFYICIGLCLLLRQLYCFSGKIIPFSPIVYGIWCYFPPVFTTIGNLFFLLSLLNSLDAVSRTVRDRQYKFLRYIVMATIVLFMVVCITLYIFFADKYIENNRDPTKPNPLAAPFFYCTAFGNPIVGSIIVAVTVIYIIQLKKFTYTYMEKRFYVYGMLYVTIFQIVARSVRSILNANNFYDNWEKICGTICIGVQIESCCYFIIADILPSIAYILYLGHEIKAQETLEGSSTSQPSSSSDSSRNFADLLEKLYKNKDQMKKIDGPDVNTRDAYD